MFMENTRCMSFDIKFKGKALRTLVESQGLPSDSTCALRAEPGKLDIKRCQPGILFISLSIIDFCVDSVSLVKY